MIPASTFTLLCLPLAAYAQTYSATYQPDSAPEHTEEGQTGTNKCGTTNSQDSMCQNVYINSVDDFCLYAPPQPGANATIGETERIEVAWCLKDGYGTRTIPANTIKGAHFVQTPDYVQVTGVGDLTQINIPEGDTGGELDPHGADGNGNPIGGLVFSNAFDGKVTQIHEWTNFMSAQQFCIRACKDGPGAPALCQHIYDEMGCAWNMPANYDAGVFEKCQGDSGEPMGVYGSSTFHQGDPATPDAHPAPSSSMCTTLTAIGAASVTASSSGGASATGRASVTQSGASGSRTASGSGTASPTPGSSQNNGAQSASGSWRLHAAALLASMLVGAVVLV